VHHGTVKLAGHIGSAAAKGNAERAAQRVRGVTAAILDIDVTEEGSTEPLKELKYVKNDMGAKALWNEPRFRFRPGSHDNQLLTILSCEFTTLFSRMQLTPRLPLRIQTPDPGSI
jgi:hypothetical protein